MIGVQYYPSPKTLLDQITIDCQTKTVLEPSAGKGDIVDHLFEKGAARVLTCEIDPVLAAYVQHKSEFLKRDFLDVTAEEISHIHMIVMNPPFAHAEKHILHAYNTAPEGCEIIAICNAETIRKNYRYRELSSIMENYGVFEYVEDAFKNAERKTDVEIAIIRLFKPIVSAHNDKWEGFFESDDVDLMQGEGVVKFNEIQAMVNTYVSAVKFFDNVQDQLKQLNAITASYGMYLEGFALGHDKKITSKREYAHGLQKRMWNLLFKKMNIDKYVTRGVRKSINEFVEHQQKYPFSVRNIYRMFEVIFGTREQTFNRAVEEAIDHFTKYTHENRFGVEGWKSNSGYMLNKKFIINYIAELNYSGGISIKTYRTNYEELDDLVKVLCSLRGVDYDKIDRIEFAACDKNEEGYLTDKGNRVNSRMSTGYSEKIINYDHLQTNTWYQWAFFEFKVFKKGTMHLKFIDEDAWYLLNKKYGEIKGFSLPETYKPTKAK